MDLFVVGCRFGREIEVLSTLMMVLTASYYLSFYLFLLWEMEEILSTSQWAPCRSSASPLNLLVRVILYPLTHQSYWPKSAIFSLGPFQDLENFNNSQLTEKLYLVIKLESWVYN